MRALGLDLPGLSRKSMWDRPYPPGVHGPKSARRRKMSDFKKQLLEKQKLRYNYGLNEGQFRRLYHEAVHPAARQLVCHGHFLVNGKRLDIPSYRVREGDVITLRERSKELAAVDASLGDVRLARPEWIEFDEGTKTSTVKALPKVDSVPFPLEIDLVIEYYSKQL
jgi:small subunit ribosomal protein S4